MHFLIHPKLSRRDRGLLFTGSASPSKLGATRKQYPDNMRSSEAKSEIKFLGGPQSRWQEFKFSLKILFEFVKGFRALHFVGPCVTFFGSARFEEDHEYYALTRKA